MGIVDWGFWGMALRRGGLGIGDLNKSGCSLQCQCCVPSSYQLVLRVACLRSAVCSSFPAVPGPSQVCHWQPLAAQASPAPSVGAEMPESVPRCQWCEVVRGIQVPALRSALGTTPRGAQIVIHHDGPGSTTSVGPKCSKCERCYHTVIAKHISHCERFASYCARVPFIL